MDNSFRVRVLGRRMPGVLPLHDLLDAEVLIESGFLGGRLGLSSGFTPRSRTGRRYLSWSWPRSARFPSGRHLCSQAIPVWRTHRMPWITSRSG
ncbi:DUF5959 family protein [Streptomyces sp. NPDC000229]|uniref:DUF5959 family protein n=1 Tax=Streptomyces sp. NPDC000229 TaxID=3154247 RepID=UPI0033200863